MKILFISLPKNISEPVPLPPVFKSPPITHLWLSAIAIRGGHSASILDALSRNLNKEKIFEFIRQEKPDIIGFTVFTNAFHDVMYMSKYIKENFPNIRIAVGGYHVNSMPSDFFSECIDFIFVGETEFSLLELMNRLELEDSSRDGILGLIYKNNGGQWISNPPSGYRMDFDNMPILPYEMILDNGYTTWWTVINPKRHKYMATVTGKGCPMQCSFCDISKTEGLRYRSMSAERVIEEISYMNKKLGITHIEFRDPYFTVDQKRVEQIAQGILDKGIRIEWGCSSTISKIKDPSYLSLLYDSGCRFIFFGVESGNPEILKREKKVSREQVFEVVKMVQDAGIQAHCSFIFGLEGETEETMKQTIDMALKLNPYTASFSIAVPYPGTQIYDSYKAKGYIKTSDWKLYGGEDPVFETEAVTKEMLKSFLEKAHKKFYFRPSYMWKRLAAVRSLYELKYYVSIAVKMLFDVVSYKR